MYVRALLCQLMIRLFARTHNPLVPCSTHGGPTNISPSLHRLGLFLWRIGHAFDAHFVNFEAELVLAPAITIFL